MDAKEKQTVAFYEKFLFKRFAQRPLSLWMHRKKMERIVGWGERDSFVKRLRHANFVALE